MEDFILAPKAGKEGDAAECQHAGAVGVEGDAHVFFQAAHVADVLLAGAAVDDRACAQEQQRFEKRVGDEMEHADGGAADSEADHHVAELRNGGVGEDALDVVLSDGDERAEEGGDGADPGDDLECDSGGERASDLCAHKWVDSRDEEDASGDHGGRVDESADGGRAFHRVGQPDVQRDLAGLAGGSAEDEQADAG